MRCINQQHFRILPSIMPAWLSLHWRFRPGCWASVQRQARRVYEDATADEGATGSSGLPFLIIHHPGTLLTSMQCGVHLSPHRLGYSLHCRPTQRRLLHTSVSCCLATCYCAASCICQP